MKIEDIRQALATHMDAWDKDNESINVERDNHPSTFDKNRLWLRFSLNPGQGLPLNINGTGRTARRLGQISIQIFVPKGTGTTDAMQVIDSLCDHFATFTHNDLYLATPTITAPNMSEHYYQYNLTIGFRAQ